jgi:hypothetical protein
VVIFHQLRPVAVRRNQPVFALQKSSPFRKNSAIIGSFTWWTDGAMAASSPRARKNRPARGVLAPALEVGEPGNNNKNV